MKLEIRSPTPLEYFTTLVADDRAFPLLEAAASLAQDEYPKLDVQQVLSQVDQLIARLKHRIPEDAADLQRLRAIQQFFYHEMRFTGNANSADDAASSYLHAVLRTRKGIAVSLAVIWLEIAQAIGLNACGVSFPGHFMVKVKLPRGHAVIDPLTGKSLSFEELSQRLEPYKRGSGLINEFDAPLGLYLQAAKPRDILARMLRNLQKIYRTQKDWQRLSAVQNRLIALETET